MSKQKGTKEKSNKNFVFYGTMSKFQKGFGFVTLDEESRERFEIHFSGEDRDIYVAPPDIGGAMDGDKVEIVILPSYLWRGSRPEAQVSRVTERKFKEVVGTFYKQKRFGFVVPETRKIRDDIFVSRKNFSDAGDGDKVVVEITGYPEGESKAEGKIVEIIARKGEKGADIKALIRAHGYTNKFNHAVRRQARDVKNAGVSWNPDERRDLRNKNIFTIDGADSKDFDDAVSIEILENGNYLLGVHIADVSEYATEGSPLDKEALARGTSVYLIDQVVPMLPEELSNDICSLRPDEDRLTLSVNMEVSPDGDVRDYEIYKSVIRSKFRMVYDDVSDMIETSGFDDELRPEGNERYDGIPSDFNVSELSSDEKEILERAIIFKRKYYDIYDDIKNMAKLASVLRTKRKQRGSLDFDIEEAYIVLDKNGVATDVDTAVRRSANKLIEEFMLLANETVARHFAFMEMPFVYRVHEKPGTEKIEELKVFMRGFGINMSVNADNVHPKLLAGILDEVHGKSFENVVSTVMLRSMKKAVYDPECLGHFGLALKYYCHFTSPIRRYPDLIIHRIIKETLGAYPDENRIKVLSSKVSEASELSSANERKAVELEREVEKMKKAEYMEKHIGEIFEGVISGVSNHGIYVELPNTIEGMVRLEHMNDDYYDCEPDKYRVIGRSTGNIYSLGEPVKVRVKNASKEPREIDFGLLGKLRMENA
ncbi:MAG: RNB domain-containing ribonuclease [Clostridiales bacterium]|nr:RNB domain-containing ribonuclease [Clostridiales bacterium]